VPAAAGGGGELTQRALAPGDQELRAGKATALERSLPESVASRPVAGRGGVETDRAASRPEQRGGRARIDDRARPGAAQLAERLLGGRARRARPGEVGQHQRPRLPRRRRRGERDARSAPRERCLQLLVGAAQSRRGAE
jgi:hypothetical protein